MNFLFSSCVYRDHVFNRNRIDENVASAEDEAAILKTFARLPSTPMGRD